MSFQIHNSDGMPLGINHLDDEAAKFWGKEVDKKSYANPIKVYEGMSSIDRLKAEIAGNWFDVIGWSIHHPKQNYTSSNNGWDNVKASLWSVQATSMYVLVDDYKQGDDPSKFENLNDESQLKIIASIYFLKPYFALIDYWASKGYKPMQVKE